MKNKTQKVDADISFFENEMSLERLFEKEEDVEKLLGVVLEAMVKFGISEIKIIEGKKYESH